MHLYEKITRMDLSWAKKSILLRLAHYKATRGYYPSNNLALNFRKDQVGHVKELINDENEWILVLNGRLYLNVAAIENYDACRNAANAPRIHRNDLPATQIPPARFDALKTILRGFAENGSKMSKHDWVLNSKFAGKTPVETMDAIMHMFFDERPEAEWSYPNFLKWWSSFGAKNKFLCFDSQVSRVKCTLTSPHVHCIHCGSITHIGESCKEKCGEEILPP